MKDVMYNKADPTIWIGRQTDPQLGPLYYHQAIQLKELEEIKKLEGGKTFGLLGYECEEGVKRNFGRIGAAQGPGAIKKELAKLAFHTQGIGLYDIGSTQCIGDQLEECQHFTAGLVSKLIQMQICPIVLGGGHDLAFAHYKGVQLALGNKRKVGIINFDAHFDLRKPNSEGNSGTPFFQCAELCQSYNIDFNYLAVGIQKESNTQDLFEIAKELNVQYILSQNCNDPNLVSVKDKIRVFLDNLDFLYVTVDMDGFSSAYAPGVSAPSPLGFNPFTFFDIFQQIIDSNKVVSMDIAEMNPKYDVDNSTAKLAGRIIDFYIRNSSLISIN